MAIASCSVKLISRGQGRSAVAAAAYRSGTKMQNAYDGLSHDYTRKRDITYTAILAPQNSPDWVYDRARLWNQAELTERRGNSRLAREVMIALPRELSQDQNIQLARSYAQVFVEQGMVADLAVHDSRDGNPHAHILLTTRLLDGDKFGKKCRDWDSRESLIEWREKYEELTNQYLERYGHTQRIDARSYAAQGINQIPTIHLGPYAHRMKQQGVYTERWEINQRIEEQNKEIAEINKQIEKYEKEAEQNKNEITREQRQKQEEIEEQRTEAQKPAKPEPANVRYDWLAEHYARAAQAVQETGETLQYRLTEKGKQDLAGQGQDIGNTSERLRQQTQEPDTPARDTQSKSEKQKQQDDFRRLYETPRERLPDTLPLHTRVEESEQNRQHHSASMDIVPQSSPPEPPSFHPGVEEPGRKRKFKFEDYYPSHHKREEHKPKLEQGKEKDNGQIK